MIQAAFKAYFQTDVEPLVFKAPGRVNLIGEHTDYNQGYVLPMAINLATTLAMQLRNDHRVHVYSEKLDSYVEFDLEKELITHASQKQWYYYIAGVLKILQSQHFVLRGANIYLQSNVPLGAGLSSSASLETVTAYAFLKTSGYSIDRVALAKMCQQAEHLYAGTKCGIMDQYICAMGVEEHALFIDCESLEAKKIPLQMDDTAFLICDTGIYHTLANSEYNLRREECSAVAAFFKMNSLRALNHYDFNTSTDTIPHFKRFRHVVSENKRVLAATKAMVEKNWIELGRLMLASHRSLQNDYEVSCKELDFLVNTAIALEGVYGARMTGGGFGGCALVLVDKAQDHAIRLKLQKIYLNEFGRNLNIYKSNAVTGVRQI